MTKRGEGERWGGGVRLAWNAPAWPISGGSEYRGARIPGSGGAVTSHPRAKHDLTTRTGTRLCQDLEENSRMVRQGHSGMEVPKTIKSPRGLQGTGCMPRATKGGAHRHGKRQQAQSRGAGCRDERGRLAGGGCGQRPGGRRFVPREELGSGWKIRGIWRWTTTDGEAVLHRRGKNYPENSSRKRWGRRPSLKV